MPPDLFRRSHSIVSSSARRKFALIVSLCMASGILAETDKPANVVPRSADTAATCYNWGYVAPMPITGAYGAAATSDGMAAYVAGGYYTTGTYGNEHYPLNQFNRYDLATNTWAHLDPMVDANYFAMSVYSPINNKVYVFGGRNDSNAFNRTRVYDLLTDIWSEGATMPASRWAAASAYYDGKIYIIGGFSTSTYDPPPTAEAQVWEYRSCGRYVEYNSVSYAGSEGGGGVWNH